MLRKTKIVCTLGPSTDDENVMRSLIEEGMNVARFNFSHGGHEEQFGRLTMLRKLREEMKRPVAALLDTKGPEIRLKEFASGKVELKNGQTFTLTTEDIVGDESRVTITYKELPDDVKPGDTILIDDGLIGLEVKKIQKVSCAKADAEGKMPMDIVCTVMNGGMVSNKKGVNVPNVELSMPYISEKDYGDIVFAVENDYDFIAASFVRCADDVLAIRKILEEKGGEAEIRQWNVADYKACESAVKDIVKTHGSIDILVNNAGITKDGLLMGMSEEDFDQVIDVNLKGTFNMMRFVSRQMLRQRSGRMISMASVVGIAGNAGQANYAASKAGIIGMTKSAARELASRGVTVNAVAPGFIETEMTAVLSEEVKKASAAQIPLGHFGRPEDIAKAVAFLASDDAAYITGQIIQVDGGMVI